MESFMDCRAVQIMGYAIAFSVGAVVGWYSRRPKKVVMMPDRAPNGKFLPWKEKAL